MTHFFRTIRPKKNLKAQKPNKSKAGDNQGMKIVKRQLPTLVILFALLSGCAATKTGGFVPSYGETANSEVQIFHVTDSALAELIIEFLAAKQGQSQNYQMLRKRLKAELSRHFPKATTNGKTTLRFETDGMSFLLPVQFADLSEDDFLRDNSPPTSTGQRLPGDDFIGEILDLAWIPGKQKHIAHVVALFADSVTAITFSGSEITATSTTRFPRASLGPVHSAHPAGVLRANKTSKDFSILTTSLATPVIFSPKSGKIREVRSGDLVPQPANLTSWFVQAGKSIYYARQGGLEPFRHLLQTADGRKVLLDKAGYLKLFKPGRMFPAWSSPRPWGSRLFPLASGRIAVCDGRQNSFIIFSPADGKLSLLGQSPQFDAVVAAVTQARYNGKEGLMVALSATDVNGVSRSYLQFIAEKQFRSHLPAEFAAPSFPDHNKELLIHLNQPQSEIKIQGHEYPEIVAAQTFDTLFRIGYDGAVLPVMAVSANSDSSNRVWEITLRDNIQFSDGSPLTAATIKKSWEARWRKYSSDQSDAYWLWSNISGALDYLSDAQSSINGMDIIDARTLKITLEQPRSRFTEQLSHDCFSVRKAGRRGDFAIGTGPFKLVNKIKTSTQESYIVQRNDYYYGGRPPLQGITFVLKNERAIDALSGVGLAGTIVQNQKDVNYFRQVTAFNVSQLRAMPLYFLVLNSQKKPLSNKHFRQYIATRVIQPAQLSSIITAAECETITGLLMTSNNTLSSPKSDAQPAFANMLKIAYKSGDNVARQIAERVAARMTQLNIPIRIPQPLSGTTFKAARRTGEYDFLVDSYTPRFAGKILDLANLLNQGYQLEALTKNEMAKALNSNSLSMAKNIETQLLQNALFLPLVRAKEYVVLPRELRDVQPLPGQKFDFAKAWIPK